MAEQYYRGDRGGHYVSLGVADAGVGVLRSLVRNYPELDSDAAAVVKAIQPGTTGAPRGSENAGAGLFFTRALSVSTKRHFALYSGSALFRTSRAKSNPPDSALVFPVAPYPGTVVSVEVGLDDSIDMSDFLVETRTLFFERAERTARRAAELVRFT